MAPTSTTMTTDHQLYVSNLPVQVTSDVLINILRMGLPHLSSRIVVGKTYPAADYTNSSCFIEFADREAASLSMQFLDGRDYKGNKIKVRIFL